MTSFRRGRPESVDHAGDDHYVLAEAGERGQSIAWDLGVSLLLDRAGDDRYEARGLAQAFAAQNGLALLVDLGGSDAYSCVEPTLCQGRSGENRYAGGRGAGSLGAMFDLGADFDTYSRAGALDGSEESDPSTGLRIDR